ncbi:MAG: hypothetical protein ABW146_07430 [Candidatus Sedimenticola sp. 6PFRAG7]
MLNTANLSLEQAPPISVPFRFFLTAPLFGIGVGLCLLVFGPDVFLSRWNSITLSVSHLVTLGMLAMVMCGAMFQMLPVLAGSPVPKVMLLGTTVHTLLVIGTLFLVVGFSQAETGWMFVALFALGGGFAIFIVGIGTALWHVGFPNFTVTGMRVAVAALAVTVFIGVTLVGGVVDLWGVEYLVRLADIHVGWGVLGWVGLLIIGVSYQVVPMFHITPEYPLWMRKGLAVSLFFALMLWSILEVATWNGYQVNTISQGVLLLLLGAYVLFAVTTYSLILRRRRKVRDITLMFWKTGLISAVTAFLFWLHGGMGSSVSPVLLGVLVLVGFAVSLVNGMLYKIVPFLSWFHLQNRQMTLMNMDVMIPHMKEFVPDKRARLQFYAHLLAVGCMLGAVFVTTWLSHVAGLFFVLSNAILMFNLLQAVILYRETNTSLYKQS